MTPTRWAATTVLALSTAAVPAAPGAAFDRGGAAGCDYALRGEITADHAAMVEAIGTTYDGVVLCLDSTQGALDHALDLHAAIWRYNVMTYVPAGWVCEGPCAVAFMGGSINTGTMNTRSTDRYMHPLGRLAFYMPDLDVPEGGTAAEMERAFARGVEAMARLEATQAMTEGWAEAMPLWVLTRILAGTPDAPVVLTAADAESADIILTEDPRPNW